MNWFSTILRVAGSQFPGGAVFAQLWSEIDSGVMQQRIKRLEDPISFLHPDVQVVSGLIYEKLSDGSGYSLHFDDDIYLKYGRCLAVLEASGFIRLRHALGRQLPIGMEVSDPSYVIYICAIFADSDKMAKLVAVMEACKRGQWLQGREIQKQISLPLPIIEACFDIYAKKGYGLRSREIGSVSYYGKV